MIKTSALIIKLPISRASGLIFNKNSMKNPGSAFKACASPNGEAMISTVKNIFVFSYPNLYCIGR